MANYLALYVSRRAFPLHRLISATILRSGAIFQGPYGSEGQTNIQGDAREKVTRLATVSLEFMPEAEALRACVKVPHLQSSVLRRLIIYWPLE